eukprot:jgi/Psemu1/12665/gm1.12665_g
MSAVAQLQAAKQAPFFFKPMLRYEDYPPVCLVHSVTRFITSTPPAASTPGTPGASTTLPPEQKRPVTVQWIANCQFQSYNAELRSLLKKIFCVNPVSAKEWNFVIQADRDDAYQNCPREGQSIRRKLSNLYRKKIQLGIQHAKMLWKAKGGDGHQQYGMIQGYEEDGFISIKEEDLFGKDDDNFPIMVPLGQPTQPTQEPTLGQPSQLPNEDLPSTVGAIMLMTPSP